MAERGDDMAGKQTTICVFDKYILTIPADFKWHQDGLPGKRALFVSDRKETVIVSFEEGGQLMDMVEYTNREIPTVSYQCCQDGKYIHQKRNSNGRISCAFFHMELEDGEGKLHHLPGQIVVSPDYQWTEGIEPVLMELLQSIHVQ